MTFGESTKFFVYLFKSYRMPHFTMHIHVLKKTFKGLCFPRKFHDNGRENFRNKGTFYGMLINFRRRKNKKN